MPNCLVQGAYCHLKRWRISKGGFIGVKTHLSQYGIGADKISVIVEQLKAHGMTALSETRDLTLDISQKILEKAL